jgi:hypothetical protein
MCDWCERDTEEKRRRLRDAGYSIAVRFESMAQHYRALALGRTVAHSNAASAMRPAALSLIRLLVEEWL